MTMTATLVDLDVLSEPFTPPTRPQSALSAASDTSHFALHDEGPASADPDAQDEANGGGGGDGAAGGRPVEHLPLRTIVETIRRHKGQCLLCGRRDDLTVMRAVLQQGADPDAVGPDVSRFVSCCVSGCANEEVGV